MGKLIGYARVSTRVQDTDRQVADVLAAGVRRDDLYIDHGVSGAHARRPQFDKALDTLHEGDTLMITTLDRLGRSTANMLALAEELRAQKVNLRVLNLGGGNVDTGTPIGSMVFTVMAALAQMELEIKRERVNDSNTNAAPPASTSGDDTQFSTTARSPTPADSSNKANPLPTSPATSACPEPPCTGESPTSTHNNGSPRFQGMRARPPPDASFLTPCTLITKTGIWA